MTKKIFFLNTTLNIGGAEKVHYEIVRHLDNSVFTKKLCCLYGPGTIGKILIEEGADLSHSLMKNKYDMIGIYNFFRLIKKERPDLLCIQSLPLTLFLGFICGKILKVPSIVAVVHDMIESNKWTSFKSGLVNKLIMHRLDKIIVVSEARMNSLIKEYNLKPEKLILIHNSIDTQRFVNLKDGNGFRREIGVSDGDKIIGMVGRLVYEKAYDIFLRSARKINERMPNSKFLVIGDGKERKNLEILASSLGIRDRVIFLGERQDIPRLIALFDVAVLSSRIESFPVALLEYMAASRPIVATDVGGNSEIILHGETGYLVPSEQPEALAKAVVELFNDRRKAEEMGRLARKTAENRFSLERMMSKMEKFFLDL